MSWFLCDRDQRQARLKFISGPELSACYLTFMDSSGKVKPILHKPGTEKIKLMKFSG